MNRMASNLREPNPGTASKINFSLKLEDYLKGRRSRNTCKGNPEDSKFCKQPKIIVDDDEIDIDPFNDGERTIQEVSMKNADDALKYKPPKTPRSQLVIQSLHKLHKEKFLLQNLTDSNADTILSRKGSVKFSASESIPQKLTTTKSTLSTTPSRQGILRKTKSRPSTGPSLMDLNGNQLFNIDEPLETNKLPEHFIITRKFSKNKPSTASPNSMNRDVVSKTEIDKSSASYTVLTTEVLKCPESLNTLQDMKLSDELNNVDYESEVNESDKDGEIRMLHQLYQKKLNECYTQINNLKEEIKESQHSKDVSIVQLQKQLEIEQSKYLKEMARLQIDYEESEEELIANLQKVIHENNMLKKTHEQKVRELKTIMLEKETMYNRTFVEIKRRYGEQIEGLSEKINRIESQMQLETLDEENLYDNIIA